MGIYLCIHIYRERERERERERGREGERERGREGREGGERGRVGERERERERERGCCAAWVFTPIRGGRLRQERGGREGLWNITQRVCPRHPLLPYKLKLQAHGHTGFTRIF